MKNPRANREALGAPLGASNQARASTYPNRATTAAVVAKNRYDEAIRVRDAYAIQLGRRLARYGTRTHPEVLDAEHQLAAAERIESDAWQDWRSVDG